MSGQSFMVEPGAGETLRFLDDSALVLKAQVGDLIHYEYVAAPSAKGSAQHIHADHDETFFVVEGTFEFSLGEETVIAPPGSFLKVDRGQPHGFRNAGEGAGRIVGTFGSRFADYFRELAAIIEQTGGAPSPDAWRDLYGRYNTRFYSA